MTDVDKEICGNCVFYQHPECHRYPPKSVAVKLVGDRIPGQGDKRSTGHAISSTWPVPGRASWCGEYTRKETHATNPN